MRLEGCDAATIAAFAAAPAMFRHPDNPKLQAPVGIDAAQGVGIYRAPDGADGEIYYRRQLRGAVRFYGSSRRAVTCTSGPAGTACGSVNVLYIMKTRSFFPFASTAARSDSTFAMHAE